MRGLLWMKASRNKQEVGRSILLWPHPLLPLPFLIWSMKGFSPPLRDVPRCNGMPSLRMWIMKALIETYSGPGIRKSRGNVQTEWWLSYWIYYSRVKKHMSLTINNNTQIQGVHQGTPTENENFLKLQNVLALVQDNLQSRDFEQDFVGWKNLNEGQN